VGIINGLAHPALNYWEVLLCDYSLHAQANRDAVAGETLVTTTFRGTATRGFASPDDPNCAVCMKPGTELAFAGPVIYDNRWIWTRQIDQRVAKFVQLDPESPHRHHDAIEFNNGDTILVTQLCAGQIVTVVQLPNTKQPTQRTEPLVIDLRAIPLGEPAE
jgi:hypothetical protein